MTVNYDLTDTNLIGWVRRSAGDILTAQTANLVGDGTPRATIGDDGAITVTGVEVAFTAVPKSQYKASGATLTFTAAPAVGDNIFVQYNRSKYSDAQFVDFLTDAAREIITELRLRAWSVDPDNNTLDAPDDQILVPETGLPDPDVEKLLVYRAAINVLTDKANTASAEAIGIRDGDTAIDNAKGSAAVERRLKAARDNYKDALTALLANRFKGIIVSDWTVNPAWY